MQRLIGEMKRCYQHISSDELVKQTVYEHGLSVMNYCLDYMMHVYYDVPVAHKWINHDKIFDRDITIAIKCILNLDFDKNKILNIFEEYSDIEIFLEKIKIESQILHDILTYCLYHDCGKPFCRTVDCNGKAHFLNHETVSYKKWIEVGGSKFIGDLILYDMALHRSTVKDLDDMFDNLSKVQWSILIMSAFSEIHSNAEMFGGIDSISFKIKFKKVFKNVKHILKKLASK